MRLIIAGGRDFNDAALMLKHLIIATEGIEAKDITVISGLAKGADLLGLQTARANGINVEEYPVNWTDMKRPCVVRFNKHGAYNALAGMNRNKTMGYMATHLIAFWDGKSTGTKDMINFMKSLGKPVYVVNY